MSRVPQIIGASIITVMCMPCMFFFFIGFLASGEIPEQAVRGRVIFSFLQLACMFGLFFVWKIALKKLFVPGRCSDCGFDLKGLDSVICPECGMKNYASKNSTPESETSD